MFDLGNWHYWSHGLLSRLHGVSMDDSEYILDLQKTRSSPTQVSLNLQNYAGEDG